MKNANPISLRRTYLIARRDFVGYIKTWGFWLTALGPFVGILVGVLAPFIMMGSEPTRYVSVLDETGKHARALEAYMVEENEDALKLAMRQIAKYTVPRKERDHFNRVLDEQGVEAARALIRKTNPTIARHLKLPDSKLKFVPPPATTLEALKPYLDGRKTVLADGGAHTLDGVLYLKARPEAPGGVEAQYWTIHPTHSGLLDLAKRYFRTQASRGFLQAHGIDPDSYVKARRQTPKITTLNPLKTARAGGQEVTTKDKIPYFVAAGFSMLLWFTVFTGAYMLLMSMVEEKINKVLEMLLASTRFSEIFFGKLLGVAALTLASLLPWIALGALGFYGASVFADGAIVEGLVKAMSPKMMIFLPIFFVLGYVFYGSMFIALGALAESMQDASTLMTPMVLILTACIMVVPIGIVSPDSPVLDIASWVPFSAPFAAVIRLPANPPLWQTLGSVSSLLLGSAFVVWGSSRLFKHGVLAGNGLAAVRAGLKSWIRRVVLRRKNA